jgi:hypothetical protein
MIHSTPRAVPASIRRDAAALVHQSFKGQEVFSCLSGSTVAGDATARSDIDIVVVLPDGLPLHDALHARAAFTRGYLALHHRHGRTPDDQWPGEVLYAGDLRAACLGAAFDLDDTTGPLVPAPLDTSHRYWTSMTACSVPLTRPAAWAAAARRSARIIAAHVLCLRSRAHGSHRHGPAGVLRDPICWASIDADLREGWGIPPARRVIRAMLDTEIRRLGGQVDRDGHDVLGGWRTGLRAADSTPPLDAFQDRWRDLACADPPVRPVAG